MGNSNHSTSPVPHAFVSEKGILGFGFVGGVLLFVALSGIAIWLLPFSVAAQITVLMHTALGLMVTIPFTLWQLSHWLATRKSPRCFRKFCAYTGFWSLAVTSGAGLILAWQAFFSLHTSHFWDRIHLWSGLLAVPFLAYHAWPHAKKVASAATQGLPLMAPPNYSPARRRMWKVAFSTAAGFLLGVVAVTLGYRAPDHSKYELAASYNLAYGKNPFAPSLAVTQDGKPVHPEILASSKSCGVSGCHSQIYQEWQASAHRWSAEDKFFQAVQGFMIKEEGAHATRYCAGCHDPVSLLAGYKDASTGISAPGFKEGASCVVCHAMRRVDVQGNANYVFARPNPYLFEYKNGGSTADLARFLIRAYPQQHKRDYDLTLARRPELCATCHKQFIDKTVNHFGWVQLQNQYDDWKKGKWNADANPARNLRCQQCHMYYLDAASYAHADPYDLKQGLALKYRNHYFAASNQQMPEILSSPGAAEQIRLVNEWLRGERVVPEIAHLWPEGPIVPLKIVGPDTAHAGETVELTAVVSNNKVGHSFPTGPLDLIRGWVEMVVRDGTGREIFHTGKLDQKNYIEPGSFVFKSVGVDQNGEEIVRHDLWRMVGAKYKRAVFAGYSDMGKFQLKIPKEAQGPLQITARLRYRKMDQYFMDLVFPGQGRTAPITDLSSDRKEIHLVDEKSRAGALARAGSVSAHPPQTRGGR